MKNPPDLSEATIKESLLKNYKVTAKNLQFIPEGYDSWIYVCQSDQLGKIVLKIKRSRDRRGTIVYKYLTKRDFKYMPKLLFNQKGWVWSKVGQYYYYVQEYVESKYSSSKSNIEDADLPQLAIALKELHSMTFPWYVRIRLQKETFYSAAHAEISGYAEEAEKPDTDMYQGPKEVYLQNRDKIHALLDCCKRCGEALKQQKPKMVVVHDDIKMLNIICTKDDNLYIVDWDRCRLAPIENDLMYLNNRQLQKMSKAYGRDLTADRVALKYYRSHLLLRDMCLFWGEATKNKSPEVREHFLELFKKAIPRINSVIAE